MKKIVLMLAAVFLTLVNACPRSKADDSAPLQVKPKTITAQEAYRLMVEYKEYILLDVRTETEYQEKHIEGAILIPDYELKQRAQAELPDKKAAIFVYCRSGRRSAQAAITLAELGYVNVYDSGGIINWPEELLYAENRK